MFKNLFKKKVEKRIDTYEEDLEKFTNDILASNWAKIKEFEQAYKA